MASHIRPYGAKWPDVIIASMDFAREAPWKFLLFVMAVLVVGYLLLPKLTNAFRRNYRAKLSSKESENQETQDLPLEDDVDV